MLEGPAQPGNGVARQPLPVNKPTAGTSMHDSCPARRAMLKRDESPPVAYVTRRRRLSLEGTARCLAALDLRDKGI